MAMKNPTSGSKLIVLIVLMGLVVRVSGIWSSQHIDESYQLYNSLRAGKLDFSESHLMGVYSYISFAFYALLYVVGRLVGLFGSLDDFIRAYCFHTQHFYLYGRLVECLAGTFCIYVLYRLGKKFWNQRVGWISALFLAVNLTYVQISQSARGQAFCALFMILALYAIFLVMKAGKIRTYAAVGFWIGLAASIRIFALGMFVPLAVAAALGFLGNASPKGIRKSIVVGLLTCAAAFGVAWLLGNVNYCLNVREGFSYLKSLVNPLAFSGGETVWLEAYKENALWDYLANILPAAFGWPLYVLAIVSTIAGLRWHRRGYSLVLSVFSIAYIAVISRSILAADRYLAPAIPALILSSAVFLDRFFSRFIDNVRYRNCALGLVMVFLAAPSFNAVIASNIRRNSTLTQDTSRKWILENIPDGASIVVESSGYAGPFLKLFPMVDFDLYGLSREELKKIYRERTASDAGSSIVLRYLIESPPSPRFKIINLEQRKKIDIDRLIEARVEYVVVPSEIYDTFQRGNIKRLYPGMVENREKFYDWVKANGEVIKVFDPGDGVRGKRITLYRMNR